MSGAPRAAPSMRGEWSRPIPSSTSTCRCSTPATSMRGSGSASASRAEPGADRADSEPPAGGQDPCAGHYQGEILRRHSLSRGFPRRCADLAAARRQGRIERCHLRDASWFKWPLLEVAIKTTSSPTSALQQIVQLLVLRTRSLMRKVLFDSFIHGPLTEPAPSPTRRPRRTGESREPCRRVKLGALVVRYVRSMPAPATAANWKSMRSTMRSTISNASACISWPRLRHADVR